MTIGGRIRGIVSGMRFPILPTFSRSAALVLSAVAVVISVPPSRAAEKPAPAATAAPTAAAGAVSSTIDDVFKRALFEEEGHRDYDAAMRGYEEVVRALDEQRRLAATAVFRLGECYRKLNRTNDAVAQFQRLLRDFSAEDVLVKLSRQNLGALGVREPGAAAPVDVDPATGIPMDLDSTTGIHRLEALKGALARLGSSGFASAATNAAPAVAVAAPGDLLTNEESEEIRRIQGLVANSPDLVNARTGTGSGDTPLQTASGKGQLAVVRYLLDHGAKVDVTSSGKRTALHSATSAGHKAIVELLLERGADVNAADVQGFTPLHAAAERGFQSLVELLLLKGAAIDSVATGGQAVGTPLGVALRRSHPEVARFLLSKGANPNLECEPGRMPLVYADSVDKVRLLFKHGADAKAAGGEPLVNAVSRKDLAVAEALLAGGADPNAEAVQKAENSSSNRRWALTPLWVALGGASDPQNPGRDSNSRAPSRPMADLLVAAGADLNRIPAGWSEAPLHLMVQNGDPEWLSWALDHKANPNLKDPAGAPLLLYLPLDAYRRKSQLVDQPPEVVAASSNVWTKVLLLLDHGADPNLSGPTGYRLTHFLAANGGVEEMELLRSHKAWFHLASTGTRDTPLMVAAGYGNVEVVKWLVGAGVEVNDVDDVDADGNTALHLAAIRGDTAVVKLLLEAKADPDRVNRFGQRPGNMVRGGQNTSIGFGFPQITRPSGGGLGIPRAPIPQAPGSPQVGARRGLLELLPIEKPAAVPPPPAPKP